jgi:glycosyltransferase involved in cell wall biosynthesis
MKLIIYAPNIHKGGGLILLKEVLKSVPNINIVLILDFRIKEIIEIPYSVNTIAWIKPTIISRFYGEILLRKINLPADITLCFHGLPPVLKNKGFNVVYTQNKLLFESKIYSSGVQLYLRILFEKVLFRFSFLNANIYIAQTPSMIKSLQDYIFLIFKNNIDSAPLLESMCFFKNDLKLSTDYKFKLTDFLYISSGENHKNHLNLFEAWSILAKDGIYPTLSITLPENDPLVKIMDSFNFIAGSKIINIKPVPHENISTLYNNTKALIFPSKLESLGLPLLEANAAGIPILAGELDYVRDVCNPIQTFNPNSPLSIARAVKRFLSIPEIPIDLISSENFLEKIIKMHNYKK